MTRNSTNFENRSGGIHLHQRDESRRRDNGRGTVHHDAEGAMIGVAHTLVGVDNLRDSQKSQHDHAHNGDGREGARPPATTPDA